MTINSDDDTKTVNHGNNLSSPDINDVFETKTASTDNRTVTGHIGAAVTTVPENSPEALNRAADSDFDDMKNGDRTSGEIQIYKLDLASSLTNICYEVPSA